MEIKVPNGKYQSVAIDKMMPYKYDQFCAVWIP